MKALAPKNGVPGALCCEALAAHVQELSAPIADQVGGSFVLELIEQSRDLASDLVDGGLGVALCAADLMNAASASATSRIEP